MLASTLSFNYSVVLSLSYFINYAFIFLLFFFLIFDVLNLNNNVYFIVTYLKFSKRFYSFFILALISFLGVPPFSIFSSKFAALTNSWVFSNLFFFLFVLLTVFLSFALYLQIFDTMFSTTKNSNFCFTVLEFSGMFTPNLFYKKKNYILLKNITILGLFLLFGFIVFKDFILFLFLFI